MDDKSMGPVNSLAIFFRDGVGEVDWEGEAVRGLLATDVLIAQDWMGERRAVVFGAERLRRITSSGQGEKLRVARVGLDYDTDDLERLLALVEVVRGWHEYESCGDAPPVKFFHVLVNRGKAKHVEIDLDGSTVLGLPVATSHHDASRLCRFFADDTLRPLRVGVGGAPSMHECLCDAKAGGCQVWFKLAGWNSGLPKWQAFSLAEWP